MNPTAPTPPAAAACWLTGKVVDELHTDLSTEAGVVQENFTVELLPAGLTASRFADHVDTASRGGVHPLVIDLTGVDVLASAAVRVLFAARDAHATHAHPLTLLTHPGSLPAQVLDLVGLPEHPPPAPPEGAHAGR